MIVKLDQKVLKTGLEVLNVEEDIRDFALQSVCDYSWF